MLRDRSAPVCLFALGPQLALQLEPELAEVGRLLDADGVFQQVNGDLRRRWPHRAVAGRPSTPVEGLRRRLVVKHLSQWSDEQTEHFVNESLVRRQFCRLGLEPVPDDTTLLRWADLLPPDTLPRLLDRVLELARALRVTRGRKVRRDSTVVEPAIPHPAESTLLAAGVRGLSRALRQAKALGGVTTAAAGAVWRDRPRAAKRLARRIGATTVRGRQTPASEQARRAVSRRLLDVARASRRQAAPVRQLVAGVPAAAAARRHAPLDRFLPRVRSVVAQAERRVPRGERGPATEKVLSLCEPHGARIRRGKARQPTEFGANVGLDEVAGGLGTGYARPAGNPADGPWRPPALAPHQACCRRPPSPVAADRHFFRAAKGRPATAAGVRRVGLPSRGGGQHPARAQERERWFRRGHGFRAGIAGRIRVLRRRVGWRRCRYHGRAGLERRVGWGILAHDPRVISRAVAQRPAA